MMDIKSAATTAKMVIESLVVLLDSEGVDVESIKMDINGGNQELDFKKLIDLALSELKLIQDSGAQVPEGFVLVPKEPTEEMWGGLSRVLGRYMQSKNRYCPKTLKRHLDMFAEDIPDWLNKEVTNWNSDHAFATADLPVFIYKSMLSAQEQSNESN